MLTHSAKMRVPSQIVTAKRKSPNNNHNNQTWKTCDATTKTGFATIRNVNVFRISSLATFIPVSYGNRHRYIVRQKPSAESLFGSQGGRQTCGEAYAG